jgi:hypothetical protein
LLALASSQLDGLITVEILFGKLAGSVRAEPALSQTANQPNQTAPGILRATKETCGISNDAEGRIMDCAMSTYIEAAQNVRL